MGVGGGYVITNFLGYAEHQQMAIKIDYGQGHSPRGVTGRPEMDLTNVKFYLKFTNYGPLAYRVGSGQDDVARISRNPSCADFPVLNVKHELESTHIGE